MPPRDVPCPANQFFSVVLLSKVEAPAVRRVRRFVPASVVLCILRGKLQPEHGRSALVQRFRPPAQLVLAAVREVLLDVLVSAMFRAA